MIPQLKVASRALKPLVKPLAYIAVIGALTVGLHTIKEDWKEDIITATQLTCQVETVMTAYENEREANRELLERLEVITESMAQSTEIQRERDQAFSRIEDILSDETLKDDKASERSKALAKALSDRAKEVRDND